MRPPRPAVPLALLGLVLLALAARSLFYGETFGVPGETVLRFADAAYQARRALFGFVNFPAVLGFDAYLAHPGGALVPMPPLYSWLLAALGRLLVADEHGFARVLAWTSPFFGAATLPVVYALARSVAGRGEALSAAALFALMPIAVRMAQVGDCDHHAFVALLASLALLAILRLARPGLGGAGLAGWTVLAVAARVALALGWSGSLLYLALIEALLLGAAWLGDWRRLLLAQAIGAAAAALLLVPWLATSPAPAGGPLSTTTLSWFHAAALAGSAAFAAALRLALPRRYLLARRGVRPAGALLAAALVAAALFWTAESLAPGLAFLGKQDVWSTTNREQRALFSRRPGESPLALASTLFGLYGLGVPFVWLAPLLRARSAAARAPLLLLSAWLLPLGALASFQVRFGGDLAPAGCVGFVLALSAAGRRLPARLGAAAALVLGVLLLLPAVTESDRLVFARSIERLRGAPPGPLSGEQSLALFGAAVRASTPETSGYLDARARPEYGLLCRPGQGHTLLWTARRPTPAGNFGPYVDPGKYRAALRFYDGVTDEGEAFQIARSLDARYVVTYERGMPAPTVFPDWLHVSDGSAAAGVPASGHFRLVLEGPPGGAPLPFLTVSRAYRTAVPFKLFEVVEGALLEIEAPPNAALAVVLDVRTPAGRGFRYRAPLRADAAGKARARVPYATERAAAAWAESARIEAAGGSRELRISEAQVQRGDAVRVAR